MTGVQTCALPISRISDLIDKKALTLYLETGFIIWRQVRIMEELAAGQSAEEAGFEPPSAGCPA